MKHSIFVNLQRILVATDFSRCAHAAFDCALDLAQKFDAELILFHALEAPSRLGSTELAAFDRESTELALNTWLERARSVRVRVCLGNGEPSGAIIAAARRENVDLIALGVHGTDGIERVLSRKITDRVLRDAPCPVLTVRSRMP